ncbi:MAG: HlyD family type I secretion periplasmic adaptor subunit [Leptolyngbya sp. SIO1E4]|nr:HlyD family type I secretion periplasmic adaptor subunit [Leptolyngbya sp. SIO1E4]
MEPRFIARSNCNLQPPTVLSTPPDGQLQPLSPQAAAVIHGGVSSATPSTDTVSGHQPDTRANADANPHWSEALQSLLEQPPATLPRHMIAGGVLFVAVVGLWSWSGAVKEVSTAEGKVSPRGDVYKVQPSVNGEVTQIFVEAGDVVEQGQTIAEIDHQLIEKEIQRLEESLANSQLQLGQTEALIQQTQSELNILQAMAQADIAARQSSLSQEKATINTHHQILAQLQDDRQAQIDRMARLEELVDQGALAKDHLFQLEQSLRERERSITETQGNLERSEAAIDQLEAELAQTKAVSDQQELTAQEKLQQLQMEATSLIAQVKETQILLDRSKAELAQTVLKAPVSGVVSVLEVANVGEVLQPGETIAEIAPGSAPLILSTLLPSQEAGLVDVGMPVNIKFDAFPYQDYGIIPGSVLSISPDAKTDEERGAVYEVDIALDQAYVEHDGQNIPLKAGQTATAEIVVRQRRILNVLLDPIRKLQKRNINL